MQNPITNPTNLQEKWALPLRNCTLSWHVTFRNKSKESPTSYHPWICITQHRHAIPFSGLILHGRTPWWFFAGYVCARGFCQTTRTPMRLCNTLHVTSTVKIKALKKEAVKKQGEEKHAKRVRPNRHLRWTDLIVAWHSCVQIVAD